MLKPVITIIGHTCIDNNVIDGVRMEGWGSPAMYMAYYYLENFGIKPNIVSSYGSDFSKYTKDFIFTEKPSNFKTLVYENIVDNGKRVQFCRNSEVSVPVLINHNIINILRKTDVLLIAPQLPNYNQEYIAEIMQYTGDDCLKVLLPQGYMRSIDKEDKVKKREFIESSRILPYFDAVIASDEDYDDILTLARAWSEYKNNSSIAITRAEKGTTVFHRGKSKQIPTTPIPFADIKNPVGSGDIFSAQFAMELYNNLNPYEAAKSANQATAKALVLEN